MHHMYKSFNFHTSTGTWTLWSNKNLLNQDLIEKHNNITITYVKLSRCDLNFKATFWATLNPSMVDRKSSIFFLLQQKKHKCLTKFFHPKIKTQFS